MSKFGDKYSFPALKIDRKHFWNTANFKNIVVNGQNERNFMSIVTFRKISKILLQKNIKYEQIN